MQLFHGRHAEPQDQPRRSMDDGLAVPSFIELQGAGLPLFGPPLHTGQLEVHLQHFCTPNWDFGEMQPCFALKNKKVYNAA